MTAIEFKVLLVVVFLSVAIAGLLVCWRICRRAGVAPYLSLLIFVPVVNIIAVYRFCLIDLAAVDRHRAAR